MLSNPDRLKDKVLPLIDTCANDVSWGAGAEDQRDADWERVRPVIEALRALMKRDGLVEFAQAYEALRGVGLDSDG